MDNCIIRVLGDEFKPEVFLATTTLTPSSVFRKGEQRPGRRRPAATSGFTCDVGAGTLEEQIELATEFIARHAKDLKSVSTTTNVESFFVDFAYECRLDDESAIVQRDFLPATFVRLAGEVGIGVCLSLSKALHQDADEIETDSI